MPILEPKTISAENRHVASDSPASISGRRASCPKGTQIQQCKTRCACGWRNCVVLQRCRSQRRAKRSRFRRMKIAHILSLDSRLRPRKSSRRPDRPGSAVRLRPRSPSQRLTPFELHPVSGFDLTAQFRGSLCEYQFASKPRYPQQPMPRTETAIRSAKQ
jgi:hypothetical protein